jgi:hypothetical protein
VTRVASNIILLQTSFNSATLATKGYAAHSNSDMQIIIVRFLCVFTGLDDDRSEREETDSTQSEFEDDASVSGKRVISPPEETNYVPNKTEELGQVSEEK